MRIQPLLASILFLPLCSCAQDLDRPMSGWNAPDRRAEKLDPLLFDLRQSTCALYVAVHSAALEGSIAFGRDTEDITVHWNKCSTGNMVACASAPTANGDTVVTGIPFPY